MLVHHPHDLARVHRGAAAQRDDAVRLKQAHRLRALERGGEVRIRRDVVEAGVLNPELIELFLDRGDVAVLVEERIGDDEAFFLAHHRAQLVERHRHAALLEIHLLRRAEPEHVLSPLGNGLDIEQVLHADVFGDGVAAPRAAAQRQRRRHLEVIQVADAAEAARRVDDDAAGLHAFGVLHDLFLLRRMDVQGRGVAVAAVADELFGLVERLVKVLRVVHRQHRGELFVRKLLGKLDALDLADEDFRLLRHIHARQRRDGVRALADDLRVQRAVDQNRVAHPIQLIPLEEVAAAARKLRAHLVVNAVQHRHALLGGADHAVVKRLGMDDRADSQLDIRRLVDDDRGVARADAQRRFAGGIRRVHHTGAAGGEDDIRLVHQFARQLQTREFDAADDALRRARLDRRLVDDARGLLRALLGTRVRADEDGVARLEAQQRLENRRGGRVRGRDDRRDKANRLRNLLDAERRVFLQHADRLGVAVGMIDILAGVVVLNHLVFHHAHAGLLDRHFGQRNTRLIGRHRRLKEDVIHLFLREFRKFPLCLAHESHALLKRFHRINRSECLHIVHPPDGSG